MSISRKLTVGAALVAGAAAARTTIRRLLPGYDYHRKVIVITGGSRGLGLVLARQLAAHHARIAILARDCREVEAAVNDVASRGAECLGLLCDLRDRQQIEQSIQQVYERFGRVDVLINNAGVISVGPLDHMNLSDYAEAMAIHFWAPLHATLAALPYMRLRGDGRIVNISSIGGKIGVPHLAPYCASKFALVGLSESLRAELAEDNITVTTVCPGLMRTGSHLNARFKGRHREEFTWFALSDALPLTSISVERAARQILAACARGDAQLTITLQAKFAVFLKNIAPEIFADLMNLAARFLPDISLANDNESFSGWESTSRLAPSVLTRLADRETVRNNELAGHSPIT
jgi:NAD(P)-dependent dehydrogenase (short-subunit alcohol dehydrogenase family)